MKNLKVTTNQDKIAGKLGEGLKKKFLSVVSSSPSIFHKA